MYYVIHASHLFGQKTQRHTVIILLMDLIELGNIHHLQDLRLLPFTPHERKCVIFGYHDVRNKFTGDGAEDSFTIQDCLKLWEDGEWDDKNETEANRPANEAQLRKWEGLSKFLSGKVYGNFSLYSPLGTSFLCVVAVVENTKAIWLQKMVLWRYR